MDPWGNMSWNQGDQAPPDPNEQQGLNNLDLAQRILLAQQQQHLLQNYEDSQQGGSNYYPADDDPIAFDYPYQVVQNSSQYGDFRQHSQGSFHPYHRQQQPFSLESRPEEPIDVDGLDIQESVARRPSHFHQSLSNAHGSQMATMPSTFENERQGSTVLALSVFPQDGRNTVEEPAQKRAKMENAGDGSHLVQPEGKYYPLASRDQATQQATGQASLPAVSFGGGARESVGEEGNAKSYLSYAGRQDGDVDALIDDIFGADASRDSYRTDMNSAAPPESAAQSNASTAYENASQNIDDGIFDDAEVDVDLATGFQFSGGAVDTLAERQTEMGDGQSLDRTAKNSSEIISEADGDVFSDAADDATVDVVQEATKVAKTEGDPKTKKKKATPKPKQPLKKPLATTSPKEKRGAKDLLKQKTDLTLILPENACRFLGKEFWIFTQQQFEHVFDTSSAAYEEPGMKAFRTEIRDAIVQQVVYGEGTLDSSNETAGDLEPRGVERLLVLSQETVETAFSSMESMKGTFVDLKSSGESQLEKSEGQEPGEIRHDLLLQTENPATRVLAGEASVSNNKMDERPLPMNSSLETSLDSAAKKIRISEPANDADMNVNRRPQDEATAVPLDSETRTVTSDAVTAPVYTSNSKSSDAEEMNVDSHPHDDGASVPVDDETVNVTSAEKRIAAERILESWVNRLAKRKHNSKQDSLESSLSAFSLQGPLGMILPGTVRNFLSSILVSTLYEFLSIRFTEASPGVQALFAWRKLCGLEDVKPELLAKHMAGMAIRMERALSSVPPVDSYYRQWMGTALVCLTAAAKEFLIDNCRLQRPEDFLDGRTSDFSEKLVAWRESKKKSVLKGSGRVAMISSFKAAVRGCVVAEKGTGIVTTEDEIIEQSKLLSPADYVVDADSGSKDTPKAKPSKVKIKKEEKAPPTLTENQKQFTESLLNSTEFLEKVLSSEDAEFLSMHGIQTPEQLLGTEKEDATSLIIEMTKWKTATCGKEAETDSCARLLSWQSKVREEIKRSAAVGDGREPAKESPAKLNVAEADAGTASKKLRASSNKSFTDPLEVLSDTALTFLASIGITTGEEFISTRTTEIANALAEWREQEKMVPLKGSGCSATVSGWKTTVRKVAESSGEEDLAAAEETSRKKKPLRSQKASSPPRIKVDSISHPQLLHGLPQRKFLVQDSSDRHCVYKFELSVRKPKRGLGLYLTYCGARRIVPPHEIPEGEESSVQPEKVSSSTGADSFLPVLQDVSVFSKLSNASTDTFVWSRHGCGFIEVGQYGAIPLSTAAETQILSEVKEFIMNGQKKNFSSEVQKHTPLDSNTCNVLVEASPELGTQCFFYAAQPMEKGQAIELRFSPRVDKASKDSVTSPCDEIVDRLSLARSLAVLSLTDIKAVIDHLSKIANSNSRDLRAASQEQRQNEDGQQHRPRGSSEEQKLQRVRRRIHWLATQILYILEKTKGTATTAELKLLVDDAKKLLMTTDDCRSLCDYGKQSGEAFVQKELSQEILCDAVLNNPTMQWSDKSTWCDISAKLSGQCLHKASVRLALSGFDGGDDNKDQMLKDIEGSIIDAVKRVISPEKDLVELAFRIQPGLNEANTISFTREFVLENCERLPKEVVAKASQEEAYRNSMDLCGEIAYDDLVKTTLCNSAARDSLVVAAKAPWSPSSIVMRSIEEVQTKSAQFDAKWYIENHVLSIAHAIASSALLQYFSETRQTVAESVSTYNRFADVARRILESSPADNPRLPPLEYCIASSKLKLVPAGLAKSGDTNTAVPCTLPLFLAVVWPRLKIVYGFSIEVGEDPTDVTFFPPGHKGHFRRASERQVGLQRLERARKRRKVEQQVRTVGLGEISKLAKRMFVSATRDDLEPGHGACVKDALKQFVTSVLSELPSGGDDECRRRMAAVEEAVRQFFDELIPSMLSKAVGDSKDSANLECAYLMQVMLVLPSLLEQSGLSMRRVEDTLGVIRDLAQFISSENKILFAEPLRVCHEDYEAGHDVVQPFLLPRMQKLMTKPSAVADSDAKDGGGQDTELIREIIQPEDVKELSGFISTVLSQLLPCRATEYDIVSKGRKGRTVGYPGMMCRHCAGKGMDGRFFFTSLDSLNTAATATLGHIYKCPHVADDLKKRIAHLKTRHPEERKALKHGAQAVFFSRLWKRLWSAEGIPDAPVVLTNHQNVVTEKKQHDVAAKLSSQQDDDSSVEFKSHIDLLDYLTTTSPWNGKADISERVGQYYRCIAHGGEIYDTNGMPKHFNSEWILSQLVPPERLSTNRTFLAG